MDLKDSGTMTKNASTEIVNTMGIYTGCLHELMERDYDTYNISKKRIEA
jgi:hypothetical protein